MVERQQPFAEERVEVDVAEIAGTINGTLTVRNSLIIRATGKTVGIARCHRLQVEDGGRRAGQMNISRGR